MTKTIKDIFCIGEHVHYCIKGIDEMYERRSRVRSPAWAFTGFLAKWPLRLSQVEKWSGTCKEWFNNGYSTRGNRLG